MGLLAFCSLGHCTDSALWFCCRCRCSRSSYGQLELCLFAHRSDEPAVLLFLSNRSASFSCPGRMCLECFLTRISVLTEPTHQLLNYGTAATSNVNKKQRLFAAGI
jgi:hypothetical protein